MPKVKNLSGTTVLIQHWKLLPDGRLLDPRGVVKGAVPDDVAYSAAAKRLADQGVLDIEGYKPKKAAAPEPKAAPAPAPKSEEKKKYKSDK